MKRSVLFATLLACFSGSSAVYAQYSVLDDPSAVYQGGQYAAPTPQAESQTTFYFARKSARIGDVLGAMLDSWLRAQGGKVTGLGVTVIGKPDAEPDYQLALNRAKTIEKWLKTHGVPDGDITIAVNNEPNPSATSVYGIDLKWHQSAPSVQAIQSQMPLSQRAPVYMAQGQTQPQAQYQYAAPNHNQGTVYYMTPAQPAPQQPVPQYAVAVAPRQSPQSAQAQAQPGAKSAPSPHSIATQAPAAMPSAYAQAPINNEAIVTVRRVLDMLDRGMINPEAAIVMLQRTLGTNGPQMAAPMMYVSTPAANAGTFPAVTHQGGAYQTVSDPMQAQSAPSRMSNDLQIEARKETEKPKEWVLRADKTLFANITDWAVTDGLTVKWNVGNYYAVREDKVLTGPLPEVLKRIERATGLKISIEGREIRVTA